jgi:subtilisin family serine protease
MNAELLNPRLTLKWLAAHARGKGVEVAVIDSGIDASHPRLAGRISRGCTVAANQRGKIVIREVEGKKNRDNYGHGTAVAGIIADLAPSARIVNVRVLDEYNSCTGDVLIAGLRWALDQNIRLLNMSLTTSKPAYIPKLFELCERAYVQNSIIVASKRNFGDLGCPAMFSSVISVDREEYVEKLHVHYRPQNIIEFDARGTQIKVLAPGGGYAIQTGTSFATPHVCGMVALLLEIFPGLTAVEAKSALKAFSESAAPVGNHRRPTKTVN